jgi:probable HAF family extracellular repeat protein
MSATENGEFHAVLWHKGKIRDLGTLGGTFSSASFINEFGQIAGRAHTDSDESHAYLWQAGTMTDLGAVGGNKSFPLGLNDLGAVIGEVTVSEPFTGRGVLWTVRRRVPPPQ